MTVDIWYHTFLWYPMYSPLPHQTEVQLKPVCLGRQSAACVTICNHGKPIRSTQEHSGFGHPVSGSCNKHPISSGETGYVLSFPNPANFPQKDLGTRGLGMQPQGRTYTDNNGPGNVSHYGLRFYSRVNVAKRAIPCQSPMSIVSQSYSQPIVGH